MKKLICKNHHSILEFEVFQGVPLIFLKDAQNNNAENGYELRRNQIPKIISWLSKVKNFEMKPWGKK